MMNRYQTSIEDLHLEKYDNEIVEQFHFFLTSIPYIRSLIDENRPYAKDLPRDEEGKIIVDITKPHLLEDMDYFRPAALYFKEHSYYTDLRPNFNPSSEFGKFIREEIRRCYEGYIRPSDGEWIPGDMYFYLNYCPIELTEENAKGVAYKTTAFPRIWEGTYYQFHYIEQARKNGHHAAELSRRGSGKSYTVASMLCKRFLLGENAAANKNIKCFVTAYDKQYLTKDGILNKFVSYIDFSAQNTQFPSRRLKNSLDDMHWVLGYVDLNTGTRMGTLNEVIGASSKDNEAKMRGKRGCLVAIEEFGSFPNLLGLYGTLKPSVEDGDLVFGMILAIGTAGDDESDFAAAQEIMYNPKGYNMNAVDNVYDIEGRARPKFVYFFPGYINREGCYDKSGNSDVTKALLQILIKRFDVKYNTTDLRTIVKSVTEIPITPAEAILKSTKNMFPVIDIAERLAEIDANTSFFNDIYVGDFTMTSSGEVKFVIGNSTPIRDFPLKDNKNEGAIEIFKMPEKNSEGKVFANRYIIGVDPYDDDSSTTMSLGAFYVMDMFTDAIVASYAGRPLLAEDFYKKCRMAAIFYNAIILYENNKKGLFSHFSMNNCLYLLSDCPEFLRDKDLIKGELYGNKLKGVNATMPINNYANTLIKNWMIKPYTRIERHNGEEMEVQVMNLNRIQDRAFLKEALLFTPEINVDRIRALGMAMLLREQRLILYGGEVTQEKTSVREKDYLGNDEFFKNNYDKKIGSQKLSFLNSLDN